MGKLRQKYWEFAKLFTFSKSTSSDQLTENEDVSSFKEPYPQVSLGAHTPPDKQAQEESVRAYLHVLRSMGATEEVVLDRYDVLNHFHYFLKRDEKKDYIYSQPLNQVLSAIGREYWSYNFTVAREYSLFWFQDEKGIEYAKNNCHFHPYLTNRPQSLIRLDAIKEIASNARFSPSESLALKNYYQALRQTFFNDELNKDKLMIAKMLLFIIRTTEAMSNVPYIMAADKLYPSFRLVSARNLFSLVCAEFLGFWADEANAAEKIESLKLSSQFDIDHFWILNRTVDGLDK